MCDHKVWIVLLAGGYRARIRSFTNLHRSGSADSDPVRGMRPCQQSPPSTAAVVHVLLPLHERHTLPLDCGICCLGSGRECMHGVVIVYPGTRTALLAPCTTQSINDNSDHCIHCKSSSAVCMCVCVYVQSDYHCCRTWGRMTMKTVLGEDCLKFHCSPPEAILRCYPDGRAHTTAGTRQLCGVVGKTFEKSF